MRSACTCRSRKADPIKQPGPKRVQIHMLRDVSADTFNEALVDGIRANHSEAQVQALEPRVKRLAAIIGEVKEAKKGMSIALDWTGTATQVLIDGKAAGAPIEGEDFYRALLGIWLGDKPVQDDLKQRAAGRLMHYELATPITQDDCAVAARQRHGDPARNAVRHPRRDADPHVRSRPQDPLRPRRPCGDPYRAQRAQGGAKRRPSERLCPDLRRHYDKRSHGALYPAAHEPVRRAPRSSERAACARTR